MRVEWPDRAFGDTSQVSDPYSWGCSSGSTCPRSARCASTSTRNFWMHKSHAPNPLVKLLPGSLLESRTASTLTSIPRTPIMCLDFKMSSNQTITQTIPETYIKSIYVLNGIAYIGDLGHETEAKVHHTLLLSEDGTSTFRIHTEHERSKLWDDNGREV
ncbi:hypothetical protein BGZ90_011305 [Linnemannia elongata]|nr:hypothetical protein BGZ90_011305 [Linnemannia elongata]